MKKIKIKEKIIFDKRPVWLTWNPSDVLDTKIKVTQVSAYCEFNGKLILVRNSRGWCIPGGHPEKEERIEETLIRELKEEACLSPKDYVYQMIGWVKVKDPENENIEGKEYIQVRLLVELNNLPRFEANDEIFERKLVEIERLGNYLKWINGPTGKAQVKIIKNIIKEKKV